MSENPGFTEALTLLDVYGYAAQTAGQATVEPFATIQCLRSRWRAHSNGSAGKLRVDEEVQN
jgi:hypothetical protein